MNIHRYGLATISRLFNITCLYCKRVLWKRRYSAKKTYDFKEPTHRSHPIALRSTFMTTISTHQTQIYNMHIHIHVYTLICVYTYVYMCYYSRRIFTGSIEMYMRYGVATMSRLLKIVSFAKEPYKRDDILQKRLIILRSLLIVATP